MIGDGATDLEARQPGGADMFIGYASSNSSLLLFGCCSIDTVDSCAFRYGGVTERPKIAAAADWYVRSFLPLTDSL